MPLSACGFPLESRALAPEHQAKVREFKRILVQSGAWDERFFDEHDCARFLKARNYDIQAARQMWDGMLAWRRENRVDTIRDWFAFHERAEYDRVFPTGLHKTDKEGHPVLIQQLGRVNIGALYKLTTDDRIRLAHIAENEHLRRVVFPACSRAVGRPVDQLFTIIDLEGVAFTSMMRTTSLLKMFMVMDSNNYPETLARMVIINAPGWFSTSWGAVKSVLSGDTVRKIEIVGKDYQATLLRHIPRENLLAEYGGLSRGRVTDNEGPWQVEELLPEPPAPIPLVPPPMPLAPAVLPAKLQAQDGEGDLASAGPAGGDQRTPRDVLTRRSQSPVRPGAIAAAGPGMPHPAPPASPPLPKRPHHEELQLQPLQSQQGPPGRQGQVGGGSPAPSVSDSASDSAHNMAAPLLSNFMSSSESPSPQHHEHQQQPSQPQQFALHHHQASPPLSQTQQLSAGGAAVGPSTAAAAATPLAQQQLQRRSSSAGAGGFMAGVFAGLQAAVGHVGGHANHHQNPQQQHLLAAGGGAVDGGVLRPPAGPAPACSIPQTPHQPHQAQTPQQQPAAAGAAARFAGAGSGGGVPGLLVLSSPREDATGPGTLFSAISAMYSPPSLMSPLSPLELQAVADTATSRRTDMSSSGGGGGGGGGALVGPMVTASAGPTGGSVGLARRSGGSAGGSGVLSAGGATGGSGGGFGSLSNVAAGHTGSFTGSVVSAFSSAVMASGELPAGAAAAAMAGAASGQMSHQQSLGQSQGATQNDMDDAESVRVSVMSQRSFYSAVSHLDPSSSSGITSPNEASENARRWSMQRELHAAAIASALAATAEKRAAAAAAAGTPGSGGALAKLSVSSSTPFQSAPSVAVPSAAALSGMSYIVPPASQQAFGSYLDQPPPYSALRVADGADGLAPVPEPDEEGTELDADCHHHHPHQQGHRGHKPGAHTTADAVALNMGSDTNGGGSGGGMSRTPSAAAIEDCSLGAGAVRWARGWFTRRRNYGRLVESDGTSDGTVISGGVGSAGQISDGARQGGAMGRGRGAGGPAGAYATMQDGPCATSPSKMLPKVPQGAHHARGDSWEWDQPSPYDIDQTYGRGSAGAGSAMMQRDLSFGRGAERRRLLRSESPGRRQRLGEYCACLPCCTIM